MAKHGDPLPGGSVVPPGARVDKVGASPLRWARMNIRGKQIRRVLGPALASAMLFLSVAVPVFERADVTRGPLLEGQHAPGSCAATHDHGICTQLGASTSLAAGADLAVEAATDRVSDFTAPPAHHALPSYREGNPTRAPPGA